MAVSSFVNGHKSKTKSSYHGRFASQSLRRWWATRQRPSFQIPRCKSVRKFLFVDLWFKSSHNPSQNVYLCGNIWPFEACESWQVTLKLCIFDEKYGFYVHHFVDAKNHSFGNDMKPCDANGYNWWKTFIWKLCW